MMVVVQIILDVRHAVEEKKLNGYIDVNLLKREDANDTEWAWAKEMEKACKFVLEQIKPHCSKFDMEEIE
jgi:hypothetical protein